MMRRVGSFGVRVGAVVAVVAVGPAVGSADVRALTQTYEYSSVPEGNTTVQLWHTQGRRTSAGPEVVEQLLEIEHGVTERWDVGLRTAIAQVAGAPGIAVPLHLDRITLASRYRFVDRAEWPVDVLVFVEGGKQFGASVYPLELRAVVARDLDRLTVAGNGLVRGFVGQDVAGRSTELGWAAGATYQVHPKIRIGAETWGGYADDLVAHAGPVLHLLPSSKLWLTVTAGFGLSEAADAFTGRAILGIEL